MPALPGGSASAARSGIAGVSIVSKSLRPSSKVDLPGSCVPGAHIQVVAVLTARDMLLLKK
jgi:hypothetical protein